MKSIFSRLFERSTDVLALYSSFHSLQLLGGYADVQLRRLQNALARDSFPQSEKEQHIFNSVKNAMHSFNSSYKNFEGPVE